MDDERALTAYCGLYCRDCIPSNERLSAALAELQSLVEDLNLARYAELLAKYKAAFEDYPVFERVLAELAELRCPAPCRDGGGRSDCSIRLCVQDKSLEGCWECDERKGCALLEPLRGFHGETIDDNLDTIAEHGPDAWSDKRGRHYPWS